MKQIGSPFGEGLIAFIGTSAGPAVSSSCSSAAAKFPQRGISHTRESAARCAANAHTRRATNTSDSRPARNDCSTGVITVPGSSAGAFMLTTEAMIAEIPEKKPAPAPGGHGGPEMDY